MNRSHVCAVGGDVGRFAGHILALSTDSCNLGGWATNCEHFVFFTSVLQT